MAHARRARPAAAAGAARAWAWSAAAASPQGDDIDIDAAVEARVEALAGCAPNEALYVDSLRRRRDLAGPRSCSTSRARPASRDRRAGRCTSTSGRRPPSSPPRSHELGDRVALYAFSSRGRPVGAAHAGQGDSTSASTAGSADGWRASCPAPTRGWAPPSATARSIVEEQGGTSRRLLVVALRRVRLRPRLRGPLRRSRCPAGAGRGAPPRGRLPVPQRRRRRRAGRSAPGVRDRRPRRRPARRPTAADRSARCSALRCDRPRRSVACTSARSGPGSVSRSRGERHDVDGATAVLRPGGRRGAGVQGGLPPGPVVVLKGPTGCGKTRFVEAMAHDLGTAAHHRLVPRRPHHGRPRRSLPAPGRRHDAGSTGR